MNRRRFLKLAAMTAAIAAVPSALLPRREYANANEAYWANLEAFNPYNSYAQPPRGVPLTDVFPDGMVLIAHPAQKFSYVALGYTMHNAKMERVIR